MENYAKTTTKTKLFYNKFYQFLLTFLEVMLMSAGFGKTAAGQEAYAVFNETEGSLTFYYDNERSNHSNDYDIECETHNETNWDSKKDKITIVIFTEKFIIAKPKSCNSWF